MKNLIILTIFSVIFSSCTHCSKSGQLVKKREAEAAAAADSIKKTQELVTPSDTVYATPCKIGVSEMKKAFTPAPNCDGGECTEITFTIGLKLTEGGKTLIVNVREGSFSRTVGESGKDPLILNAMNLHKKLKEVKLENVIVQVISGEIATISLKEVWKEDGGFAPPEILWQKNRWL